MRVPPPARITPLLVGKLRFALDDFYNLPAEHAWAGQIVAGPVYAYHLALPGRSLLVDAPAYDEDTIPAQYLIPGYQPPLSLVEQLARLGIDAAGVDSVILTHAHFDHCNGLTRMGSDGEHVPVFPRARHYLGAGDWQPNEFGPLEQRTLGVVAQHGLLTPIEGPLDLGDGVSILPAPGETPGHQIVRVRAGGQATYITGDLYHHELEFGESGRNVVWAEAVIMAASKQALMREMERENALAYFSHIEGSYRLAPKGETSRWQRVA